MKNLWGLNRWRLEVDGDNCTWIEYSLVRNMELRYNVRIEAINENECIIARGDNDTEILNFLYSDSNPPRVIEQIIAAGPMPSILRILIDGDHRLIATWQGIFCRIVSAARNSNGPVSRNLRPAATLLIS